MPPQITLNLKPPEGISHNDLIIQQVAHALRSNQLSNDGDLILIPRTGVPIISYQAVLASLSPFFATLFEQFSWGSVRMTATVHIDLDHGTVKNILDIVYTGKVMLDYKAEVISLRAGLKLMGIKINFDMSSKEVSERTPYPSESKSLCPEPFKSSRKRSLSGQPRTPANLKKTKLSASNNDNSAVNIQNDPMTLFNCDHCEKNFKFRKGLHSHLQRTHNQKKVSGGDSVNIDEARNYSYKHSKQIEITSFFNLQQSRSYNLDAQAPVDLPLDHEQPFNSLPTNSCFKCSKVFPFESVLLQHLACTHYAKQLLQIYPDSACPFLSCQHTSQNQLAKLEHIACKHQITVNFLLQKDGLSPIATVPTDTLHHSYSPAFLTPTCQLCPFSGSSPQSLAVHYMAEHFASQVDTWDKSSCQVCGAQFLKQTVGGRSRMLRHLALRHPRLVVEFMEKEGLCVGYGEVYTEREGGFMVKPIRVELKKMNDASIDNIIKHSQTKSKSKQSKSNASSRLSKSIREVLKILPDPLKIENDPFEKISEQHLKCFLCDADHSDNGMTSLLDHMSTTHYRLEIERTYMTRPGAVWALTKQCPVCDELVEDWEVFVNHIGVGHRTVEQFMPVKFRFPKETSIIKTETDSNVCILPDCSRQYPNERSLLVHLVMSHYYKQMEDMFEKKFLEDTSSCFKCGKTLPSNKVGFMKHLGVDHGVVMELVAGNFRLEKFLGEEVKKELKV